MNLARTNNYKLAVIIATAAAAVAAPITLTTAAAAKQHQQQQHQQHQQQKLPVITFRFSRVRIHEKLLFINPSNPDQMCQ